MEVVQMKRVLVLLLCVAVFAAFGVMSQAQPRDDRAPGCPYLITMMDANKDGKVSQAEWNDVHAKHFAKMDKNGDGFLTRDEMGKGPGCDMRMKGAKHHGGGKCPRSQAPAGK